MKNKSHFFPNCLLLTLITVCAEPPTRRGSEEANNMLNVLHSDKKVNFQESLSAKNIISKKWWNHVPFLLPGDLVFLTFLLKFNGFVPF